MREEKHKNDQWLSIEKGVGSVGFRWGPVCRSENGMDGAASMGRW